MLVPKLVLSNNLLSWKKKEFLNAMKQALFNLNSFEIINYLKWANLVHAMLAFTMQKPIYQNLS